MGKNTGYLVEIIKFLYNRSSEKDEALIGRLLTIGLSSVLTMVTIKVSFQKESRNLTRLNSKS